MMETTAAKLRDLRLPLLLFAAALAIGLVAAALVQHPNNDTASRYIPMIREMAAGNWERAFHPRIQPLFCMVGAGFAVLGLTPFAAAKAASVLFYALTVFPLYWLYRRLFDTKAMLWGILYCLTFPYLLRYSLVGLRDSANTFFIACLAVGLIAFFRDRHWAAAAGTALAAAGMTLTRGESVVHAGFGLALLAGMALVAPKGTPNGRRRDLLKIAGAILLFAIAIAPWVVYCQRTTGWPVTAVQEIPAMRKIEQATGIRLHGQARLPDQMEILPKPAPAAPSIAAPQAPAIAMQGQARLPDPMEILPKPAPAPPGIAAPQVPAIAMQAPSIFSFKETLGVIPFYLMLAIAGMVLRWRQGTWCKEETLLLGLFFAIEVIIVSLVCYTDGDYLGKRYLAVAMPLALGWAGVAMAAIWSWIQQNLALSLWRWPASLICIVTLTSGAWDGLTPARWGLTPKKQDRYRGELQAAAWIRENGTKMIAPGRPPVPSSLTAYHNGRRPILFGGYPALRIAALGETDVLGPDKGSVIGLGQLLSFCQTARIHFLVWDHELVGSCPELQDLEHLPPELVICGRWGSTKYPIVILGFRPELQPPLAAAPAMPLPSKPKMHH